MRHRCRLSNSRGDGKEPLNKSGNQASSASVVADNGAKAQELGATGPANKNSACKRVVKAIFLIINLSLMTMMSATGVLGIKNSSSITDTSTVIVGLYMILFSAVLVIYEIIQIYPCSLIDNAYKRNFGFLYGLMGKSGFTVFMAVLSFGITDPQKLAFATGQSCTVICYHI